jgi:hypothetical protein
VDLGGCARCVDLCVGGRGHGERDVVADGAFVERGFLGYEGEVRTVYRWVEGADVLVVEQDDTARGGVEERE